MPTINFTIGEIRALDSCGTGRYVALTFDDGPEIGSTEAILDTLSCNNISATFFVTPGNAQLVGQSDAACELISNMSNQGHSVQGHSYDHLSNTRDGLSIQDVLQENKIVDDYIVTCGAPQPQFYRPPFGEITPEQLEAVSNFAVAAFWNVDSNDFRRQGPEVTFSNIVDHFENEVGLGESAVILMHDRNFLENQQVVQDVIDYFKDNEYTFVTIDECYALCDGAVCDTAVPLLDILDEE